MSETSNKPDPSKEEPASQPRDTAPKAGPRDPVAIDLGLQGGGSHGAFTWGVLDRLLAGGLVLASPLLVAMLLAEFALGLVSRFAPQMNVFDLAMPVKCLVHAVGLPIYALVLVSYLEGGLAPLTRLAAELRDFAR